MKLAFKVAGVFLVAMTLLAIAHVYYRIEHESRLFREQALADTQKLAAALNDQVIACVLTDDPADELLLLRSQNAEQGTIVTRLVALSGGPEHIEKPWAPQQWFNPHVLARHEFVQTRGTKGDAYLTAYWEVAAPQRPTVMLELSRPLRALEEEKRDAIHRALWLIASMVLSTAVVSLAVGVRFVGRPLQQLVTKTQQIADGKLDEPLELHTHDELSDLATSLNGMCEKLSASQRAVEEEAAARVAALEQLRHADRLQTVGRLASGMAHELGTPLNVVAGRANLIASGRLSAAEVVESAEAIKSQADRMTPIIRQLLDFARRGAPSRSRADLVQLVRATAHMLGGIAAKNNVQIVEPEQAGPVLVHVDEGRLQQVLTNLVVNAVQAMPRGGTINLDVYQKKARRPGAAECLERDYYCIDVQDTGDGIDPANLDQLFEPFFTTKGSGEGTGLGLSIAQGIVEEHGGWIAARSQPGQGACFTVYLPVEVEA
ncbi:MAG: HAMP domain-containing histidine kinase [Planctomycetales bacterium]|nr:HAMP domain-containing histidine kinase [Planctomycetales bacterium]